MFEVSNHNPVLRIVPKRYVHTCVRVLDPDASVAFYEALGYERRGKLQFETAYNIYMGLPGDADTLELTVNIGRERALRPRRRLQPHRAHRRRSRRAARGAGGDRRRAGEAAVRARRARAEIGRICFVQDPDGYRIELIDGGSFPTPQDP